MRLASDLAPTGRAMESPARSSLLILLVRPGGGLLRPATTPRNPKARSCSPGKLRGISAGHTRSIHSIGSVPERAS